MRRGPSERSAGPDPVRSRQGEPRGRKSHVILVVDDYEDIRALTAQILSRAGHVVLTASDADDARRIAARYRGSIDLLLTDLVIPGMSGHELARRLTAEQPGLQVLVMSGHAEAATMAAADPDVAFLPKPFTRESLLEHVTAALNLRDTQSVPPGRQRTT